MQTINQLLITIMTDLEIFGTHQPAEITNAFAVLGYSAEEMCKAITRVFAKPLTRGERTIADIHLTHFEKQGWSKPVAVAKTILKLDSVKRTMNTCKMRY